MRPSIVLDPIIREADYLKPIKLWETAGNIAVRQTDMPEGLARLSLSLAVKPDYRERCIGTKLVNAAVNAIKKAFKKFIAWLNVII